MFKYIINQSVWHIIVIVILLFCFTSCARHYKCPPKEMVNIHYCEECKEPEDLIQYEKDLGSIYIALNMDENERLFFISRHFDTFFGASFPIAIFLRPKNHSFLKEIVVCNTLGIDCFTRFYYQDIGLDTLIPPEILKQYEQDTFNLEAFMCFKDNLVYTIDTRYGVGKRCFHEAGQRYIRCERKSKKYVDRSHLIDDSYHWLSSHMRRRYSWSCCKFDELGLTYLHVDLCCNMQGRRRYVLSDSSIIEHSEYVKSEFRPLLVVDTYREVSKENLSVVLQNKYSFTKRWPEEYRH